MLNTMLKRIVLFTFSLLFATSWCSQPLGVNKAATLAAKKQANEARRVAVKVNKALRAQKQQANLKERQQRISKHTVRIQELAAKKELEEQQLKRHQQEKVAQKAQQSKLFFVSAGGSYIEVISFEDWKRMIDKDSQS